MSSKLVEAAADALFPLVEIDRHPTATEIAQAALLAFLEAALEDEGAVEAGARALCQMKFMPLGKMARCCNGKRIKMQPAPPYALSSSR
jgi:hypothetical protein